MNTPRRFLYARVSTGDQTTANQVLEFERDGYTFEPQRIEEEVISGSVTAMARPRFAKLVDRLEKGDVLFVTKLDRLGRNAMDVRATIELLAGMGVHVHCKALQGVDLTSPTGKVIMSVIGAIAEFERDLLIERTRSGQERARKEGKKFGRPPTLSGEQIDEALRLFSANETVSCVAKTIKTSRRTVQRLMLAHGIPARPVPRQKA